MHRRSNSRIAGMAGRSMVAAVSLLLLATLSVGQITSGTISGSVKDPSGAMVASATVTATDAEKGVTRTVTTGTSGEFVFANLPPGRYTVTVESKGFKKLEKSGIILNVGDHVNAGELVLQMGTATESITVMANAAEIQLQSNSGERSDLISSKQLEDVAMNGRNVLDYMKLIPGVISSFSGAVSGTGGLDAMNINGTRANQHEFTIDGASNVDTGNNGGTHVTINPDAIEEVKILTSNYQAEFGKAAGGQIAIVTKAGTSDFHGNVRFFHRHEGLNANNHFASQTNPITPRNLFRYNYTGYQIGGPVIIPGTGFNKHHDKLFFFWNQEFYSQLVPVPGLTTFYTPTALERKGDFSQSKDGNGNPVVIYNPATGLPFPGDKIDPITLTPAQQAVFAQVSKILNLYPKDNVTGNPQYNYATTLSYNDPRREDILRIDYQINDKNRLFGRWINNTESVSSPIQPWPGLGTFACAGAINFPGGCTSTHPGWNLSINLVSTVKPNIVNEFSVGPSVTKTRSDGVNGNLSIGKNGINLPLFYPVGAGESIPDLGFGGISNVNFGWSYLGATPWFQKNTTINVNDNLTWVKNRHAIKGGFFYQRSRKDQIAWGNINGQFSFGTTPTATTNCPAATQCGDPYASALLGNFDWFQQSSSRPVGYFRYSQFEWYLQDTWKITPRLTLDYGLRVAWIPPQYDAKNQIAVFDPHSYNPANAVTIDPNSGSIVASAGGNPLNGMIYSRDPGNPAGGWSSSGFMPEPRLGFAYDLFGDHKTVLRGGAGMMHDRTQGNLIFNTVFQNPALVVTPSITNNNIANLPSLAAQAAAGLTSPVGGVYGADTHGKVPTVYSYSLGIQRELFRGTTLDVAYVGNVSRHLVTARDINAIPYGTEFKAAAQNPACFGGTVPSVEPNLPPEYAAAGFSFSSKCAYPTAYLVPYKGYGQIEYLQFDGTSNYNSLQVSLQRRFSKGFTFGGVYTWSKALTTANADEDFQDPFNPRGLDYRAAGWDRTHVVAFNYVYDLPNATKHFGGPKWLSYVTDNFQLSGVTQFATGTPIDTGQWWLPGAGNWLTGGNDWTKIPSLYWGVDKNGNLMLPKLGAPQRGTRDILRNGGMQNWDISLFKNIPLGSNERRSLQLRFESYNAFNHTNYYDKNYSVSVAQPTCNSQGCTPMSISKNAGWGKYVDQYTGVGGPRVIQLGAKFNF